MSPADWDRSSKAKLRILLRRTRRNVREFAALALPDHCMLCESYIPARIGGGICRNCLSSIPRIEHACPRCGAPIPTVVGSVTECLNCRHGRWLADRIHCYSVYQGAMSKAVVFMKKPGSEPLALSFGTVMGNWLRSLPDRTDFDLIVPTPKHWLKRIIQAHNSPDLLAEQVSKTLNTRVVRHNLVRIKATAKQGTLLLSERVSNVKGAFKIVRSSTFQGKRILLIDDILTSGATAAEMSSVLRAAGAQCVEVACLARGIGLGGA